MSNDQILGGGYSTCETCGCLVKGTALHHCIEQNKIEPMSKTERVNEETPHGNYRVELYDDAWKYITTEFNISAATTIAVNLNNATGKDCRVISRRSNNMIMAEIKSK